MEKLENVQTLKTLKRAYLEWQKAHPESVEDTGEILTEIGNILNKEISEGEFFFEEFAISPSNNRTPQIVINASSGIIPLLDAFLQTSGIIACKEDFCLRIDC